MRGALRKVDLANKEYGTVTGFFRTVKLAYQTVRYMGLIAILIVLASHEAANPKLGTTTFEFYSTDFRAGITESFLQNNFDNAAGINAEVLLQNFYEERGFLPAWTVNFNVNDDFHALLEMLNSARYYGLLPQLYNVAQLSGLKDKLSSNLPDSEKLKLRIELERTASSSSFEFMMHLAGGIRVNDTSKAYAEFALSLPAYLNNSLGEHKLYSSINAVQPKSKEYVQLQSALKMYWAKAGSDTARFLPQEFQNQHNLVVKRLIAQGFLNENNLTDSTSISKAIQAFQKANLISPNGKLDAGTLQALSLNSYDRFNKIALNLDRLRKDALSSRNCILVNIPEFKLHYYNQTGEYTAFNVVVGKTYSRTPILSSSINRIVANPYWTVPKSITHNEIIPKLKTDSLYLQKNGFKVIDNFENDVDASQINWNEVSPDDFNYWIRQNNNSRNALGVVKFLFPNRYSVYLHDTQSKRLFKKQVRAYSHGCVRVENPEKLAQIILNDYRVRRASEIDFQKVVATKERKELFLQDSLPIHIRYYTCTADVNGTIYFHPDIYRYDEKMIDELFANMAGI